MDLTDENGRCATLALDSDQGSQIYCYIGPLRHGRKLCQDRQSKLFGFLDSLDRLAIVPQYYRATEFTDRGAFVQMGEGPKAESFHINKDGKRLLPPRGTSYFVRACC